VRDISIYNCFAIYFIPCDWYKLEMVRFWMQWIRFNIWGVFPTN
jgi:hypothetical protein